MAKITSNEYVKVAWVPEAYMTPAQAKAPTPTILNAATTVQLSPAIAWDSFALGATDSDDVQDRGITDPGNAVSRGYANYEGTISFFRDANPGDTASDYVKAWATFKVPRTYGYLVLRVAERKWSDPWVAGDRVSVFRFVADIVTDNVDGDDSVKFTVSFLQQGLMYPYTLVRAPADALAGVATTKNASIAAGPYVLAPTVTGKDVRVSSTYVSSNAAIARVSANGVVTPVSAGTANVTVSHPAATAPIVQAVTVAA